MERFALSRMKEWKENENRKPLIIRGARQVGKTETIRTFARENYKNVIEINFITEPSYKVIVEEGFSAEHIIKLISRICLLYTSPSPRDCS